VGINQFKTTQDIVTYIKYQMIYFVLIDVENMNPRLAGFVIPNIWTALCKASAMQRHEANQMVLDPNLPKEQDRLRQESNSIFPLSPDKNIFRNPMLVAQN